MPANTIYPFDFGIQTAYNSQGQAPMNQSSMFPPQFSKDFTGDVFGGLPMTNNQNINSHGQTTFGNNEGESLGFNQEPFLPFSFVGNIGSTHGGTYQTGNGNTFFHQGCNVQYTDVKTFTTTIHLHCCGSADGKQPHEDFCPNAAQNQNKNK